MVGAARVSGVAQVVVARAADVGAEEEVVEVVVEGGEKDVQGRSVALVVGLVYVGARPMLLVGRESSIEVVDPKMNTPSRNGARLLMTSLPVPPK